MAHKTCKHLWETLRDRRRVRLCLTPKAARALAKRTGRAVVRVTPSVDTHWDETRAARSRA